MMFGLFGGAGWGGKSHLLRTASFEISLDLRARGCPNKWGVLFTDTYPNLIDRHVGKFKEEFKGIGEVRDTYDHGLHIKFYGEGMGGCYLRNLQDTQGKSKGRGAERVYALFEELTEITYERYSHAMYTVRPDGSGIPYIAMLGATNPDGVSHRDVKRIFHPDYQDLTHPFFGDGAVKPHQVFFLQALASDNPAYEEQKEIIDARMAMIPDEDIKRARKEGSWDLYASGRFAIFREAVHCATWEDLFRHYGIPDNIRPVDFLREARGFGFTVWGSLDYATSIDSISAYLIHVVGPDNVLWTIGRLKMVGKQLEEQAEAILLLESQWGITPNRFADPAIWGKAAESSERLARNVKFQKRGVKFRKAVNDRVEGAATCASLLLWRGHPGGPYEIAPGCRFLRRDGEFGVPELISEIPDLPRDPHNPEDVDPQDGQNHWYDAWRYMAHTRFRGTVRKATGPVYGSAAYFDALARQIANEKARRSDRF